uniref:Uncharacterized protein n=1 Tax=Trichobilharzia regenti TaxID=157069 RepID=A0AA85JMG9_TRIRE|nr:unnamed protein product [Trichobilharzia regenti]
MPFLQARSSMLLQNGQLIHGCFLKPSSIFWWESSILQSSFHRSLFGGRKRKIRRSIIAKIIYLLRYCTEDDARAIQCYKLMPLNEGYAEAKRILRQRFGRPSMIVRNVFETVKGNGSQLQDDSKALSEFLDNLMTYKNTLISMNCMSDLNSSSVLEIIARRLPTRLQRKWVKISSRIEDEGIEPKFDDIL